jgi:hypothetical protein
MPISWTCWLKTRKNLLLSILGTLRLATWGICLQEIHRGHVNRRPFKRKKQRWKTPNNKPQQYSQ